MSFNQSDDEFSDVDDSDIWDLAAQAESARGSTSRADAPRQAKRPRLISPRRRREEDIWTSSGAESKHGGSNSGSVHSEDDLPSPSSRSSGLRNEAIGKRSRILSHVPRYRPEITFVSQLTQPPSSPSMIRGPRWIKPDPEPDGIPEKGTKSVSIPAAAVATAPKMEGPQDTVPGSTGLRSTSFQSSNSAPNASSNIDVETLLDGAFDSSPFSSPSSVHDAPVARAVAPSAAAPPRTGNMRQTTLFGGTAPVTSTIQSSQRAWPLANKDEPPTHHELDQEALKTWVYPTNLGRIRDYQYNIAHKGLFHNLLVALPTGLGKTFIAATVMLNWFRWTKSAQIVFVAPTKPLVSQQVSACFNIAGIPRSQTTMLTGNAQPGVRAEEWQSKRVFFMTPQTLVNDLKTGIADPKRIVLVVVDEAHRATGGYAYVDIVTFLRRFNSSFRLLALTATPGSTVETVQAVIDGLDISRVEIRTEQSLDIREYVHARNIEIETFENSQEMLMVMDLFSKSLQPVLDKLLSLNAYWGKDPLALTPFGLTKARQQWMTSDAGRNAGWGLKGMVNSIFTVLASLAHAIELLKYHGIGPCFSKLVSFRDSLPSGDKGSKYSRQIADNENFKIMMSRMQAFVNNGDFIGHPKLVHLRQVVLNHFMDAGEGLSTDGRPPSDTRIMIFVHFRDSAEEVTRVLKRHEPMIRPHVFVGQAAAKGSEGMDQKTQLGIIDKFKKGTYNTIVATSIGEEGLDIGEVDLIVCYDSSASPIRMLQRMGRTGRKRTGNIVLLLMKGKEEDSYIKAKDNYEKMQQLIASGSRFTFHDDKSPRILPRAAIPEVDKREIEIPVENSQSDLPEPKRRTRAPKRPPKKFNMPDGVESGFQKASLLGNDGARKKQKKTAERIPSPPPEPTPVDVPSLDDVLLAPAEQRELEQRYCSVSGSDPQLVHHPRHDAFPTLQRSHRPTKVVRHGTVTRRMIRTLRSMAKMPEDCAKGFQEHLRMEDVDDGRKTPPPPVIESAGDEDHGDVLRSFGVNNPKTPGPPTDNPARRPTAVSRNAILPSSPEKPPPSPLMCTMPSPSTLFDQPFHASQKGLTDGMDSDFDLPDIDTLLSSSTKKTASPIKRWSKSSTRTSRSKLTIHDDSDSLEDI